MNLIILVISGQKPVIDTPDSAIATVINPQQEI